MRKEMFTFGFLWYYFKHNFIKLILIMGLVVAFICAPNIYSPQKVKIKSMRTYKDGSVFIRIPDQWLQVDNKTVVVKGKYAYFTNKNPVIGTRVIIAIFLFTIFNLSFVGRGIRASKLQKLWWDYNSANIKVVYDSLRNDEYRVLNNRILSKNKMESPSYTEYPKFYDPIEIRMNTIKDIIK